MRTWLESALVEMHLPDETEGYLLGRGMSEKRIRSIGLTLWDSRVVESSPSELFNKEFGSRGEYLHDRIAVPLWAPRGQLIGCEFRRWRGDKGISQFLLPDAEWNPVFVGLTPDKMQRIWDGCNLWVCEGVFDLGALEHIVPKHEVVLATLRARISLRHVEFFRRYMGGTMHHINMVYDNDETGRNQTHGKLDAATGKYKWGALQSLSRVGIKCRDVPYRGGKDPGEIWEKTGTEGLRLAFPTLIRKQTTGEFIL